MGSSAALTTSLVGSLLQFFGIVRIGYRKQEKDRQLIHNLSQLVHSSAQGKIGSGFDVSAAVYGLFINLFVSICFFIKVYCAVY